jgi:hypothetical protein
MDAYAVFNPALCATHGQEKYKNAATSAREFVMSMYSETEGRYYLGAKADGIPR